jgi:hypothetical protein
MRDTVSLRNSHDRRHRKKTGCYVALHPSPAFAGAGLLRRTQQYASFLRIRPPCLRPFYDAVPLLQLFKTLCEVVMITTAQEDYIGQYAYVPEHILQYVTPISQTEPYLFGDFLVYAKKGHFILVGYPLKETFEEKRLGRALEDAVQCLKPVSVALIAPAIPPSLQQGSSPSTDYYFRLDLSTLSISQKSRNMLRRAGRELSVGKNPHFDQEHKKIVEEFLKSHAADEATRFIFQRIDAYLDSSKTASIFEARTGDGDLVAFDIAEFMPRDYAVYMFNFRSETRHVPGASDLLLSAVMQQAITEGKKYINLGLGINPGVSFFKEKWGGAVFLPHVFCLYHPPRKGLMEMLLRRL